MGVVRDCGVQKPDAMIYDLIFGDLYKSHA